MQCFVFSFPFGVAGIDTACFSTFRAVARRVLRVAYPARFTRDTRFFRSIIWDGFMLIRRKKCVQKNMSFLNGTLF